MAANDLTTLSFVKNWLQIKPDIIGDDGFLQHQVTTASAMIQQRLNRTIPQATYTETRNGMGQRALKLINQPVISVASVSVNGTDIPARPSPTASGFTFDEALVYLAGWCFAKGQQNIVVVYDAGYPQVPADLENAVAEVIAWKFRYRDRIGVSSKVLAGETNAYFKGLPDDLLEVIDQYKRVYQPT